MTIDEMWAWLPYNLREPATVEAIGRKIKETVARDVSPVIKVSIGAGPNKYLAKMASKMRKPDGLFIVEGQAMCRTAGTMHRCGFRSPTFRMWSRSRIEETQPSTLPENRKGVGDEKGLHDFNEMEFEAFAAPNSMAWSRDHFQAERFMQACLSPDPTQNRP